MRTNRTSSRTTHEVAHGKKLSRGDPERVWGWGTPAGQLRARRRGELIARGARLKPGVRALEIGCGTGLFTQMFAKTGAQLVAVDLSADLLEKARARGLPSDRVQFLEKPFEECEVEAPFDAIIGSSVLHHIDVDVALEKIYHLLKPGGVMSFAEPNMLNPQILVQKNISWVRKFMGESLDETAFFRWRLKTSLLSAGFKEIEIIPFDWLHPVTPKRMVRMVSRIGLWLEMIPFLREFAGSLYIFARREAER